MEEVRAAARIPRGVSQTTVAHVVLAALLQASPESFELFFDSPLSAVHYPRVRRHVDALRETLAVSGVVTEVLPLCAAERFAVDVRVVEESEALREVGQLAGRLPGSVRPVAPEAERTALLWLSVAVCTRLPHCVDCLQMLLTRMPAAFTAAVTEAAECAEPYEEEVVRATLAAVTGL